MCFPEGDVKIGEVISWVGGCGGLIFHVGGEESLWNGSVMDI